MFKIFAMTNNMPAPMIKNHECWIRYWLYVVFVFLIALIFIGGATRITGSGLSITEWQPIHGVIPPIGFVQWQEEFEKYQQITQYQQINFGMSLSEFKTIFWWEWSHRLLARIVAILALVPLLFFWGRGMLSSSLKWQFSAIMGLGLLQAIIGWWMVVSGLGDSDLASVSQYRLAVHLIMACLIIIAVLALARSLLPPVRKAGSSQSQHRALMLIILILFQIYLGALVAGLQAGKIYNSLLMDGGLVPTGLFFLEPFWMNFFENPTMVQFIHRFFAFALLFFALFDLIILAKRNENRNYFFQALFLFGLILIQFFIGIFTLLYHVPASLALLHQGVALLVLSFAVMRWISIRKGSLIFAW